MTESSRVYALYGLKIDSELDLPALPIVGARADASIRFGEVPPVPSSPPGYYVENGDATLTIPGVGRYAIRGGREIVVASAPGAAERDVRLYLLGSALGALLHQRGVLPLHANAVALDGSAVAFMGRSGSGKSTLAAWFQTRGHSILSDDVCAVGVDPGGAPVAHSGILRVRLWRDAIERMGASPERYERSYEGYDKFDLPVMPSPLCPLPLRAIYVLRRAETEPRIARLIGARAVAALVENTYRGGFVHMAGLARVHLGLCVALARCIPVYLAERAWGLDRFDEEAEVLRDHALALSPNRQSERALEVKNTTKAQKVLRMLLPVAPQRR